MDVYAPECNWSVPEYTSNGTPQTQHVKQSQYKESQEPIVIYIIIYIYVYAYIIHIYIKYVYIYVYVCVNVYTYNKNNTVPLAHVGIIKYFWLISFISSIWSKGRPNRWVELCHGLRTQLFLTLSNACMGWSGWASQKGHRFFSHRSQRKYIYI